jgi:hypothetical protein
VGKDYCGWEFAGAVNGIAGLQGSGRRHAALIYHQHSVHIGIEFCTAPALKIIGSAADENSSRPYFDIFQRRQLTCAERGGKIIPHTNMDGVHFPDVAFPSMYATLRSALALTY